MSDPHFPEFEAAEFKPLLGIQGRWGGQFREKKRLTEDMGNEETKNDENTGGSLTLTLWSTFVWCRDGSDGKLWSGERTGRGAR